MYPRSLLLLCILFIAGASMAQNVMTPTDGCYKYNSAAALGSTANPVVPGPNKMVKWVHDPSQNNAGRQATGSNPDTIGSHGFDQSTFKCYFWGKTAFRLRFPNSYDPANPSKYPLVVFMHGAGEAANHLKTNNTDANRENQDQLYWGAQLFEQRINQGEWNGFLLFPQITDNSSQWDDATFPDINNILDTLQKYNGLDRDRIIAMGLSAGGYGGVNYSNYYPQRIASCVVANPRFIETLIYPSNINSLLQIPVWAVAGGVDNFPGPSQVMQFRDSMAMKGGNIYLGYNPTLGHSSWTAQWNERDIYNRLVLSTYWNSAHKSQPLLYFQNNQFCNNSPISAKMGITAGFYAYEWQYDTGSGFTPIAGANAETYTATKAGSYRVHFKRSAADDWSAWTPAPIVISTKNCNADTAFVEHFETTPINDYGSFSGGPVFQNSPYARFNYTCQNGIFVNSTEVFTQDASGRQGGRFMMNNTTPYYTSGQTKYCEYFAGDQVWRTYAPATVAANTKYTLSFYMGNNAASTTSSAATPLTQLVAKINGTPLSASAAQATLVGNPSWKKYSFTWNSGDVTYADISITNNTTDGTGNDFVLDEISLVKYTPPVMPAGVNTTLWSKASDLKDTDGSPVKVWTNNDINGNNLVQNTIGMEPVLKNNAADNINFNPVVAYNSSNYNFVSGGFSGNSIVHSSAHAYLVTKENSTASGQTLFFEGQGSGSSLGFATTTSARLIWNAGSGGNLLTTANNANEAGKPILWTLSKDNTNGTGDGNKQDIRKNGLVIASSNSTTTFTGNSSNFRLGAAGTTGTYNGTIAEVIYLLDTTINAATENRLESYLALKYGTTLGDVSNPVKYTASDNSTVFWPSNASFQNDVFGIGTDSASGLVQTRSNSVNSGSGDGTGQSAKGNLVVTTNNELRDKRFLMIGNDAGALTQQMITAGTVNPIAVGNTRVMRNWKVINTNAVGAVDLSFDTTGLLKDRPAGGALNNYALMISNTGDATYAGPLSFITATGASGKKIIFTNVNFTSGAVFTIITNKLVSLPATWLGFTAEVINGNALLNWKTSDEINVDRYIVEHSFNGVSFSPVGSVAANNSTGENNYTLTDAGLAAGVHYYRIRRTDKDGKSGYSDIKSIKITTSGANVQVRPNPVVGSTLVLAVSVQQNSKTAIQVMGTDGKLILHQNTNLVAGNNLVNLNIANVPPGIYLVQVLLNDEVVTKKFIKQR